MNTNAKASCLMLIIMIDVISYIPIINFVVSYPMI